MDLNLSLLENVTAQVALLNVAISFALGFFIAFLYKATHRGLSYSQNFTITLVMLSVIGCVAIMVVGNSLARAFGPRRHLFEVALEFDKPVQLLQAQRGR